MSLLVVSLFTCSSVLSVWFFNEIFNSLDLLAFFENKIAQRKSINLINQTELCTSEKTQEPKKHERKMSYEGKFAS